MPQKESDNMGFYRLPQIKVPLEHNVAMVAAQIKRKYAIHEKFKYEIVKRSVDARKKNDLAIVYTVNVHMQRQTKNKKLANQVYFEHKPTYKLKTVNNGSFRRPVVIGAGPAGLFAGLILAEAGLKPIVLERGKKVDERLADVEKFFKEGHLNVNSNIQFGEGGAGTFSDGKINTGVKDKFCRIDKIVDTFIECGAPEDIRIASKPHIGTDYLISVVKNLRNKIIDLGGDVRFESCVTNISIIDDAIKTVEVNGNDTIKTGHVVLAVGHSARDTFRLLVDREVPMIPKAFAVGLRIEHPQEWISKSQFGEAYKHPMLPVADYKLTYRTTADRAVYTFCMCPGGFVVNAASEEGGIVCNGMSNYARDERNANSAVLVNVHPEDFEGNDILSGVEFQRTWERKAYELTGKGYGLPVQRYGDFCNGQMTESFGQVQPNVKGHTVMADLNKCLPTFVTDALKEGIDAFGRKIKGFNNEDAVLVGVETRSSSPVRMTRDEFYESPIRGLYPCGEGAGYAGGIMSAALDGIKVAEAIIDKVNCG